MPKQFDSDRDYDVTIEEVRALASFKDYNDEQIVRLLDAIKVFARIAFAAWSKRNAVEAKIITLTPSEDKQKSRMSNDLRLFESFTKGKKNGCCK